MKSILAFFAIAFLLIAFVPVRATVADAGLEWDIDTTICGTSAFDTLKAANDSSTILASTSKIKGQDINTGGWTYYLQLGRLTGTSKDTSNLCIAVDGYTFNDSLIGRVRSDTSADRSETYTFTLPINTGDATGGDVFFADKYLLKVMNVSTGTTTAQTILNTIRLIRSRPIQTHKMRP